MAAKKNKTLKIEKEFIIFGNKVSVGDIIEINYKEFIIKHESMKGKSIYSRTLFNFNNKIPLSFNGFDSMTFEEANNLIIESQI